MRVLLITTSYPVDNDDPRGIHIHRLARSLIAQGAQVEVVVPASQKGQGAPCLDGVAVHRVSYWIPRFQSLAVGLSGIAPNVKARPVLLLQVPLLVLALAVAVLRRSKEFDVVHAHWVIPAGTIGILSRRGVPLVITSHGGDMKLMLGNPVFRAIARWTLRRADRCLGVSEELTNGLQKLAASATPCAFQPLGVDETHFKLGREATTEPATLRPDLRVIFVGSLIERKQPKLLLEALADLADREVSATAVFIGDGPLRRDLEVLHARLGLPVELRGDVSPADVAAWLQKADVLVLPSLSEGRPVVIMEAMAVGLPVVATDISGVRELVEDGRTGYLVPTGSASALADALAKLAGDPERRNEFGLAGYDKLNNEGLLASHVAKEHLEIYADVATTRRQP